jgi:hypothetical protein
MFCPECRSEYVEGVTECVDCQVPLVEVLPPLDTTKYEYENFVTFKTYFTRPEAELNQSVLTANNIESFIFSDDAGGVRPELAFFRGVRLLVHKDEVQKAQEVFVALEEASQNDNIPGAEELSEEPQEE